MLFIFQLFISIICTQDYHNFYPISNVREIIVGTQQRQPTQEQQKVVAARVPMIIL